MGSRRRVKESKSYTLPSSPSHSSSSSEFEFTISISPRNNKALCPADELFYKGQLLPLHLSQRISMVRTLLLSSPSTAARHSSGSSSTDSFTSDLPSSSSSSSSSSRPSSSSITDQDDVHDHLTLTRTPHLKKPPHKYFSVFHSPVKRISVTAREVIRKYFNKVKNLSHHKPPPSDTPTPSLFSLLRPTKQPKSSATKHSHTPVTALSLSHSFSGNLRYPRKTRTCVSSCPSSIPSSPNHSGVLSQTPSSLYPGDASSIEELQSAIQGAIAHCKNSFIHNKTTLASY
ncbi:hypothetical protein VNO78_07501 [Psophocarpus tetragonolobus]|uniref:Membrane-associated kinase regulator 1 n=1 Tax=Psophocarpus tetragonolobus TaxID=3891 RepID=A0AAN9ST63_PSOTE